MNFLTGSIGLLLFFAFVALSFALLPSAATHPVPQELIDAVASVAGFVRLFDYVFPVDTLFTVLTWALLFHVVMWIWRAIRWTLGLVRGAAA